MEMFDYVIVGAGSAGSVLAARLSEDPAVRVLLLEAGPPDAAAEIAMPAAFVTLSNGPYAWPDATVPQRHAGDRAIPWPHGRTLGGSSSINGLVYMRGNRPDYDGWRDDHGCEGWGYESLLPYFKRAEDRQHGASEFHGAGGPMRVEDPRCEHPLSSAWLDAARAHGLAANADFNGAEQEGAGRFQLTQRKGRRWSTADGYQRPAADRENLTIETGAMVTAVVIQGGRAVGVSYRGEREVRASREVILCGGAVNTPQLLMLSGIGPAEHLREHGIEPIVDSPRVGQGLQDHPMCMAEFSTPGTRNSWEEATPENMALWQREGRGPFASTGAETIAFTRTGDGKAPDLQHGPLPGPARDPELDMPDRRGVALLNIALGVTSRGSVTLRSADPFAKPAIDPGYLADEADLDTLVRGVELSRAIANREPLAGLIEGERTPGDDAGDLREWVRANVATAFHPGCSCAMGGNGDAPLDPDLCVRGVEGLRVVDASAMPVLPRGNTNAPVIALAERAADLIRLG